MKRLVYLYSNGEITEHKNFISERTMKREGGDSDRVEIYKCNEYEVESMFYARMIEGRDLIAGEYVMTHLLK